MTGGKIRVHLMMIKRFKMTKNKWFFSSPEWLHAFWDTRQNNLLSEVNRGCINWGITSYILDLHIDKLVENVTNVMHIFKSSPGPCKFVRRSGPLGRVFARKAMSGKSMSICRKLSSTWDRICLHGAGYCLVHVNVSCFFCPFGSYRHCWVKWIYEATVCVTNRENDVILNVWCFNGVGTVVPEECMRTSE